MTKADTVFFQAFDVMLEACKKASDLAHEAYLASKGESEEVRELILKSQAELKKGATLSRAIIREGKEAIDGK